MKFSNKQSGYSLIETLVAISVLLLSIIGPMTIASKGIQSARYAGEQITATYLAQEGIETVLAIRNKAALDAVLSNDYSSVWDWTTLAGGTGFQHCRNINNKCNIEISDDGQSFSVENCAPNGACVLHFDASANRQKYSTANTGNPTQFTREIYLNTSGDEVVVTSTVTWESDLLGVDRSVEVTSSVFNIYDFTP